MDQTRHRSLSILSNRTNSTWRADVFGPRRPRGAMVFSGPDSLRMHRQRVLEPLYTGEAKQWTPEQTSTAFYLMRAAPGTPHPRPKSAFSDAYGWGAWGDTAQLCSWSHNAHPIKDLHRPRQSTQLPTAAVLKLGTFRQLLEQRATHAYQGAWYPGKDVASNGRAQCHTSQPANGRILQSRHKDISDKQESTLSRSSSIDRLQL